MNNTGIISPECASIACVACTYEDCACECHLRELIDEENDDPSQDEYDGAVGGY